MNEVRVLIVEDEPVIAENIAVYLNSNDFAVSGIAYDDEEAKRQLLLNTPDVVLLDINLESEEDGIGLARHINERYKIPLLFLTSYSDRETLNMAKSVESWGYIVKPFDERALLASLEMAIANFARRQNFAEPPLSLGKINKHIVCPLSEREFEVLQEIYEGRTNEQIASQLLVSINTIKKHINSAYFKIDGASRSTAIARLRDIMKKK